MKNKSRFFSILILSGIISFNANAEPCNDKNTDTSVKDESPADYLEFESVLDGKCQILSQRGKLRVFKNTHPDKAIKYRFNRIFAGKRQASVARGTIEPNGEPVKLGCTKVDGKDQTWEIKVVSFVE